MNPSPAFIQLEPSTDTLIVRPLASLSEFQYQHIEDSVKEVVNTLTKSGLHNVVVDFKETTYFGSSAVEALIRIGQEVKRRGGTLTLQNLTKTEREVLDILHVSQLWTIR